MTAAASSRYKWVALSNTTIGMLMATINSSIVLISLPAVFRGIGLNPLTPGNVSYLLWMLMGYMVVTAVLVVSLGRIGDLYGRVRLYNLGFAVFTIGAIGLTLMVAGLGASLPSTLFSGLTAQGVPAAAATGIAHLPPVGSLFAAFLGYNPMGQLLGPLLAHLPPSRAAYLTGHSFFPQLISGPFMDGMHVTFAFAGVLMLVAAAASWMRGSRYVHEEEAPSPLAAEEVRPLTGGGVAQSTGE